MKRVLALAAVLLLCTVAVSAQGLTKYKEWEQSPEGYFLTPEEREQWRAVTTDEAAEQFVADFRARRGGDKWVAEVKKRAEMADKYLTIGKSKGAATLRGKAVILFGAPANIAVSDRAGKGAGYAPGASTAAVTDLGVGATASGADGTSQKIGEGQAGRNFRDFTFTFPASASPAFNGKDYVVYVEADAATGTDRVGKGMKQKELDAIFEATAKASIKQQ